MTTHSAWAPSKLKPSSSMRVQLFGRPARQARQSPHHAISSAQTRSPGAKSLTAGPTASTTPGEFVAGDDGRANETRVEHVAVGIRLDEMEVGAADAAGPDADDHLVRAGRRVGQGRDRDPRVAPDLVPPASEAGRHVGRVERGGGPGPWIPVRLQLQSLHSTSGRLRSGRTPACCRTGRRQRIAAGRGSPHRGRGS